MSSLYKTVTYVYIAKPGVTSQRGQNVSKASVVNVSHIADYFIALNSAVKVIPVYALSDKGATRTSVLKVVAKEFLSDHDVARTSSVT